MALSITGIANGLTPIDASHITQFYNLLTGVMTDQPVTLKNRVAVGGNQITTDHTLTLVGITSQTGFQQRSLKVVGDANPTFAWDVNGKISWGAGGASAPDTTLERQAAGILKINGSWVYGQIATPSAPGASTSILYFKADGLPYFRSGAAGAETAVGGTNTTDPLVSQVFG